MPFDLKKYLDSLELDEAEKKVVATVFAKEKNVAEMNRGYSARDEASRLMDEGTKAKTEAEAERVAAAAEKAEAARIKAEVDEQRGKNVAWADALKKYEGDAQQTQAERDALAAEKAAYEEYLKSIGVEPSFALSGKQPITPPAPKAPPEPEPKAPAVDPKMFEGYLKREDVVPAVNILSNLPFELAEVSFRHVELYGKPAPSATIQEVKKKYFDPQNTRPFTDIAAEEFHFADREKEIAETALEERAEKMAQERFEKRLSELHLPSAQIDQLTANAPASQVRFAGDEFAKDVSRTGDMFQDKISDKAMDAFLALDAELAEKGVRPSA